MYADVNHIVGYNCAGHVVISVVGIWWECDTGEESQDDGNGVGAGAFCLFTNNVAQDQVAKNFRSISSSIWHAYSFHQYKRETLGPNPTKYTIWNQNIIYSDLLQRVSVSLWIYVRLVELKRKDKLVFDWQMSRYLFKLKFWLL